MMHSQQNINFPKDCCLLAHDREQITWHQIEKQLPEPSLLGDPQTSKKKFSVFWAPTRVINVLRSSAMDPVLKKAESDPRLHTKLL